MRGARKCYCCGEEEGRGCVRGFRCGCDGKPECDLCKHCENHHVEGCTLELRMKVLEIRLQADIAIATLREEHEINIFAYGGE